MGSKRGETVGDDKAWGAFTLERRWGGCALWRDFGEEIMVNARDNRG